MKSELMVKLISVAAFAVFALLPFAYVQAQPPSISPQVASPDPWMFLVYASDGLIFKWVRVGAGLEMVKDEIRAKLLSVNANVRAPALLPRLPDGTYITLRGAAVFRNGLLQMESLDYYIRNDRILVPAIPWNVGDRVVRY